MKGIVIIDLLDTYHEKGKYSFQVVFDPKRFKNCHLAKIEIFDPNSNPIDVDVKKWGKKMSCSFNIGESISDGVCLVKVHVDNDREHVTSFWVIK